MFSLLIREERWQICSWRTERQRRSGALFPRLFLGRTGPHAQPTSANATLVALPGFHRAHHRRLQGTERKLLNQNSSLFFFFCVCRYFFFEGVFLFFLLTFSSSTTKCGMPDERRLASQRVQY
jgi:hypothetical protein